MLVGSGLLSTATLLFNRPVKGLMLRVSITVNFDYEDHYDTLKARQNKGIKNNDTLKESVSTSIVSAVRVQCKCGGMWTHGTILEQADVSNNRRSSRRIRVTRMGYIITRNSRHM